MNPEPPPDEPLEIVAPTGDRSRWRRRLPLAVGLGVIAGVALLVVTVTLTRGGGAQEAATRFMSAVNQMRYAEARSLLCEDGRRVYDSPGALRAALGLLDRDVESFTVGDVTEGDTDGDARSLVRVDMVLGDGERVALSLSVTREHGRYVVCGF